MLYITDWIPRRRAIATAFFGTWPDLSMRPAFCIRWQNLQQGGGGVIMIVHIRNGGYLSHQVFVLA